MDGSVVGVEDEKEGSGERVVDSIAAVGVGKGKASVDAGVSFMVGLGLVASKL